MKVILPVISHKFPSFAVSSSFAQNVAMIGGVPRLLVQFAQKIVEFTPHELSSFDKMTSARLSILGLRDLNKFTISEILILLATSFTNKKILHIRNEYPFANSSSAATKKMSWNYLSSIGLCLIQDDDRILVPYHLISYICELDIQNRTFTTCESYLIDSIKLLTSHVEMLSDHVPAWSSWEAFGACFHSIRINSFMLLGNSVISVAELVDGSKHLDSEVFQTKVELRVSKVFRSACKFTTETPQTIPIFNHSHLLRNWVDDPQTLWVVLNGENGEGVDIILSLKKVGGGYFLIYDQRKRLSKNITATYLSNLLSKVSINNEDIPPLIPIRPLPRKAAAAALLKIIRDSTQAVLSKIIPKQLKNSSQGPFIPKIPSCVSGSNNQMTFGVMNVYSDCDVEVTSESVFLVSLSESKQYHGSLADHPGCSIIIDVNTCPKESLIQVLEGTLAHRRRIANQWVKARVARSNFANLHSLDQYLKTIGGEISESHSSRICF